MTLDACARLVERGDPDRFRAAMAAPPEARRVLFPLYAFNLEVARVPWLTAEPLIAEMRLQWWRDVLDEIARGGPVERHEVTTPLADVLDPAGADALDALVEARRADIERTPFADGEALRRYIEATAGGLMWTAARLLGSPPEAEPVARGYGFASGAAAWLSALPELSARGRMPLPPDMTPAALAAEGIERLDEARQALREIGPGRPALYPAWWARPWLRRVAAAPEGALERIALSEPRKRALLLWTAFTGRI